MDSADSADANGKSRAHLSLSSSGDPQDGREPRPTWTFRANLNHSPEPARTVAFLFGANLTAAT
jgi:hypothetical protein